MGTLFHAVSSDTFHVTLSLLLPFVCGLFVVFWGWLVFVCWFPGSFSWHVFDLVLAGT